MHKMRKLLMTKKRLDGSTFMVMFSGSPSTNLCLLLPMVLEPSCSLCKDYCNFFRYMNFGLFHAITKCYCLPLCAFPAQFSFLCSHWLVYFIHTTEELYSLHLWSYMHSLLALRDILQLLSIVSLKEQTG